MDYKLLQRYVEGNASAEEIKIVVEWLDEDENNVREYMALHKLYNITLFASASEQNSDNENVTTFNFRKLWIEALKIAAIFLVIWTGFRYLGKPETSEKYQSMIVPAGQRAKLILSDSSIVWLNSLSKITYPAGFGTGNRIVELDGEAYFEVYHDRNHPFIVKTGNMDVKVLGTKLNVVAYSGNPASEVSLLEGSVEVKPVGSSQIYTMKERETVSIRNEKVVRNMQSVVADTAVRRIESIKAPVGISKIKTYPIKNYDYFEWINGLICFDDEPAEQIIHKLEIYYDTKITVGNPNILKKKYTGKFRSQDGVEHVLKVLQLKENFKYEKDEKSNTIIIR
ncbi:MAG: FecR family protein [Dysgonamonadaceae bacterium]|jgi:ferric-dicitrate binding protein FerR (iron transport regulator)|nr:FecR family protein [Dysgonamonadaceae bacterium]